MRKIVNIILLAVFLVACTKDPRPADTPRIGLRAGINDLSITSKATAAPFRGNFPSSTNKLDAEVWFSYDPEVFSNDPYEPEYLPCHTTMTFESADFHFADYVNNGNKYPIKYPLPSNTGDESKSVYCIGLYPQGGWTTDGDFKTASHSIDGASDIMFADIIEGTWDKKFPTQTYRHLMSWIKISACATTVEAAQHWGKIKSMSISSAASVNIDFDAAGSSITYQGEQNTPIDLIYQDGETQATGIGLDLTSRDAGSIFCSPAQSYTITVVTEHGGTKTVNIPKLTDENGNEITDVDDIRGKLFVISLYFNPFDIIEGTCTLNYWNDQSEDLYLQ